MSGSELAVRLLAHLDKVDESVGYRHLLGCRRLTEEGACDCGYGQAGHHRLVQAHRDIVDLWKATKTAEEVATGTVLAGAVKIRLGAYEKVLAALARGYGIEED